MESTSAIEAAQALDVVRAADQATYAPRRVPRWYPPAIATALSVYWALMDLHNRDISAIASVAYGIIVGVIVAITFRQQGRQPRLRQKHMPAPLRRRQQRNALLLLAAVGLCFLVAFGLHLPHPWLWVAGSAFIVMNIGGPLMERSYRRAFDLWLATR